MPSKGLSPMSPRQLEELYVRRQTGEVLPANKKWEISGIELLCLAGGSLSPHYVQKQAIKRPCQP